MKAHHPYLTSARFPADWSSAEMVKQFLSNHRKIEKRKKRRFGEDITARDNQLGPYVDDANPRPRKQSRHIDELEDLDLGADNGVDDMYLDESDESAGGLANGLGDPND